MALIVLPTLNLTSFAASGTPPLDHIPKHRSFISSKYVKHTDRLKRH